MPVLTVQAITAGLVAGVAGAAANALSRRRRVEGRALTKVPPMVMWQWTGLAVGAGWLSLHLVYFA